MKGGGGGTVVGTMVTGISSDVSRLTAILEERCGGRERSRMFC